MTWFRSWLSWLRGGGKLLRRRVGRFRKYQVAPRVGTNAVRRRLLSQLRGEPPALSGHLETATK